MACPDLDASRAASLRRRASWRWQRLLPWEVAAPCNCKSSHRRVPGEGEPWDLQSNDGKCEEVRATAREPRTIKVTPGSELARILQEAAVHPVLLEQDGARFRVEADEPFARYDPEGALAGIRKGAGSWADLNADEVKEYIYRGCAQGTRAER